MRRSQVGQMVVVQEGHLDDAGRPCLGSGRTLGTWPLWVELRQTSEGYEIRIGEGRARVHPSRESVVSVLRDLGVERDEAQRQVATLAPGEPCWSRSTSVGNCRVQPRSEARAIGGRCLEIELTTLTAFYGAPATIISFRLSSFVRPTASPGVLEASRPLR
jgi:hypothetical protein